MLYITMIENWPELLSEYEQQIIPIETDIKGVYFLMDDELIVYIGRSENIYSRISVHKDRVVFNSAYYLPCPDRVVRGLLEKMLIRHYKPKYNIANNPNGILTAEIGPPTTNLTELFELASDRSITKVLDKLDERESDIIRYRYGLFGVEIHSLKVLGEKHDISGERVRQIQKKAERKIKHPKRFKYLNEIN